MMQSVLKLNPLKRWFGGAEQDEALPVQLGARRSAYVHTQSGVSPQAVQLHTVDVALLWVVGISLGGGFALRQAERVQSRHPAFGPALGFVAPQPIFHGRHFDDGNLLLLGLREGKGRHQHSADKNPPHHLFECHEGRPAKAGQKGGQEAAIKGGRAWHCGGVLSQGKTKSRGRIYNKKPVSVNATGFFPFWIAF